MLSHSIQRRFDFNLTLCICKGDRKLCKCFWRIWPTLTAAKHVETACYQCETCHSLFRSIHLVVYMQKCSAGSSTATTGARQSALRRKIDKIQLARKRFKLRSFYMINAATCGKPPASAEKLVFDCFPGDWLGLFDDWLIKFWAHFRPLTQEQRWYSKSSQFFE